MTSQAERQSKPPVVQTAKSGQHPAVQAYRKKLESIDKGATAATDELDRALQQFLIDLKTPVPKEPPSDPQMPVIPPHRGS